MIAHNASFDRRFLERFCAGFVTKPWACSMTQVAWAGEGYEGTKLGYLAQASDFSTTGIVRSTIALQRSNCWHARCPRLARLRLRSFFRHVAEAQKH